MGTEAFIIFAGCTLSLHTFVVYNILEVREIRLNHLRIYTDPLYRLMKIKKALFFWLFGLLFLCYTPCSLFAQEERQMRGERNMQEESPDSEVVKSGDVKRSPIRAILNKITIGTSLGYGLNYYRQKLPYNVMRQGDEHYISPQSDPSLWYSTWLNNPQFNPLATNGTPDGMVAGDTTDLGLQGFGHSLPLSLDLHVVLLDRFRIGGGLGFEMFSIRPLNFKGDGGILMAYEPAVKNALAWRYYGMLGTRVIRWENWDHSVEVRLGKKNFLTKFENVNESAFFNLGFMMERHFSEYFRFTLRPSLEWFSFTSQVGEEELKTTDPSLYIQAGISFNYPRLPRCPISSCHIQLEHVHNGKEFRGQPIHRWQNPKYGQNHPELQRNLKRRKDDTEQQLQKRPRRKKNKFSFFR